MYNVTITFNVNGQIISRNEKDMTLLSDSIDLIKARFNFSPEWQGYTKTAIFKSDTKKPYSRILVDDMCMVPPEAIKKSKYMSVSVFGVLGTQLITTTDQIVPLTPSGYTDDSIVSPAPTENIYQQIVTLMQKQAVDAEHAETAQGKAEEARDDAGRYYASLIGTELEVDVINGTLNLYSAGDYSPIDIELNDRSLEVWGA